MTELADEVHLALVQDDPRPVLVSAVLDVAPVVKGRPRLGKGRTFTPQKTRDYEALIAQLIAPHVLQKNLTDDLFVYARFHTATQRRRDLDNLVKALLDGFNDVVYADDKQVVEVHAWVELGSSQPRTDVVIGVAAAGPARAPSKPPATSRPGPGEPPAGSRRTPRGQLPAGYDLCSCGAAAKRIDLPFCRSCVAKLATNHTVVT